MIRDPKRMIRFIRRIYFLKKLMLMPAGITSLCHTSNFFPVKNFFIRSHVILNNITDQSDHLFSSEDDPSSDLMDDRYLVHLTDDELSDSSDE